MRQGYDEKIRMEEIESIYNKPNICQNYNKIYEICQNKNESKKMHELKLQSVFNRVILQMIYFNFTDFMTIQFGMLVCQTFHKYLSFYNRTNLKIWKNFANKVCNVNEDLEFNIEKYIYFNPKFHDNNENNAFNDQTNIEKINNLKIMYENLKPMENWQITKDRTIIRGNQCLRNEELPVLYDYKGTQGFLCFLYFYGLFLIF